MSLVLRRLFVANPILEEATRAWRKFFRVAGGPGRGLSYAAVLIIALVYLWLLGEIMLARGGSGMTTTILYFQLIAVTLAMPISVYGAIAGERERTTWEALILTRLTPGQIVVGKIAWRLGGLLVLMVVFLVPLLVSVNSSLDAMGFGPYRPTAGRLFLAELMTFAWGFVLCAFGLWVSANTRRSVTSAALIFITLLTVLALLPALLSMIGGPSVDQADYSGNYGAWVLMHVNAFYALGRLTVGYYNYNNQDGDPLFGAEWGLLQIAVYLIGAAVFLYVTYRSLKIWEEPKHRIG